MPQPLPLVRNAEAYYDCYPCAARLGDNDLLVVFTRMITTTKPAQAAILGIRSHDHGRTWSEPFTLIDTPGKPDFDANIVAWDNKVMVISTTCPELHLHGQVTTSQFLAVRSEDNGATWSAPAEISHAPYIYCSGKINPAVRFADGTLAFGVCIDQRLQRGESVSGDNESWGAVALMISTDEGCTWTFGQTVGVSRAHADGINAINGLDEPALAVCRDGSLYALMRSGFDHLYEARSGDQGRTWGEPKPSGLMAHDCPADLCHFHHPRLGQGWLAIYDHSPKNRYPLAVALSLDEGGAWSKPLLIADHGVPSCYPACVQTAAGDILLVWQQDQGGNLHTGAVAKGARTWREVRACLLGLDEMDQLLK